MNARAALHQMSHQGDVFSVVNAAEHPCLAGEQRRIAAHQTTLALGLFAQAWHPADAAYRMPVTSPSVLQKLEEARELDKLREARKLECMTAASARRGSPGCGLPLTPPSLEKKVEEIDGMTAEELLCSSPPAAATAANKRCAARHVASLTGSLSCVSVLPVRIHPFTLGNHSVACV